MSRRGDAFGAYGLGRIGDPGQRNLVMRVLALGLGLRFAAGGRWGGALGWDYSDVRRFNVRVGRRLRRRAST